MTTKERIRDLLVEAVLHSDGGPSGEGDRWQAEDIADDILKTAAWGDLMHEIDEHYRNGFTLQMESARDGVFLAQIARRLRPSTNGHRPECIWTGVPVSECGYCPDATETEMLATREAQDIEDIADSDGRLLPRGLR